MRETSRERGRSGGGGQEFSSNIQKQANFNPNFLGHHHNKNITTFFISNFPEDITTDDLWTALAKYWRVGEIYVPAKRDKFNRRFGFARFVEVKNAQRLLEQIEDTWFGLYKLRANISRFSRGEVKTKEESFQQTKGRILEEGRTEGFNKGVSFRDALGVEVAKSVPGVILQQGPLESLVGMAESEVVPVDACPKTLATLQQSFVGTLKEGILAENIQTVIDMEGFQNIKATLLGFNKVLLSSCIDGEVSRVIQADRAWWDDKFLDIVVWSPVQKTEGRRIWVRFFGTPLHVWGWDCFQKIANSFGRLVSLDTLTVNRLRLDAARAEVVVPSWNFIDKSVVIKVGDDRFTIKVLEERFWDINFDVIKWSETNLFCDGSVDGEVDSQDPSLMEVAVDLSGDSDGGNGGGNR
ncbi:zinc finger CCCH domain-containing protein [Trifolium repens]|nr:zinc finger CCCH domain-containing protein [Trifolium repens]